MPEVFDKLKAGEFTLNFSGHFTPLHGKKYFSNVEFVRSCHPVLVLAKINDMNYTNQGRCSAMNTHDMILKNSRSDFALLKFFRAELKVADLR